MTALHRVKAYFGMVPADELDAYDGYDERDDRYDDRRRPGDRYAPARYDDRYADRYDERHDERRDVRRFDDRYESERYDDRYAGDRHAGDRWEADRRPAPVASSRLERADAETGTHAPRPRDVRDVRDVEVPESRREESEVETSRPTRGRSWATNTGPNHTSVRPTSVSGSRATPSLSPVGSSPSGAPSSVGGASTRGALAVDETPAEPSRSATPQAATAKPETEAETPAPAEITSLQPTSYNEARVIGERYRDGIPVIMNLTDMDEVAAKRLVDFAAGLAFALRGSIEKVTNRVFLLSPPHVEVSAAERRKLAENSYTASS